MNTFTLNKLDELESEAIHIIREMASQFENPVLLFSGGKDSIVMTHLARKAFYPANIHFPILHIDTGHNFMETINFRDKFAGKYSLNLIVGSVQESIDNGSAVEEKGYTASRNTLQTTTLLEMIKKYNFDVALGGARRDEEKARAKERFFSHRNSFGKWDPNNQRAELWDLYNGRKHSGEHFRVFPISNWTELDIWHYINRENIELPSLYYSHKRDCFLRDGVIYSKNEFVELKLDEKILEMEVRFRTVGDSVCTGAIMSSAKNNNEIIEELFDTNVSERGTRFDDKRSDVAMESRKKNGYF